jgi:hypothetical protein
VSAPAAAVSTPAAAVSTPAAAVSAPAAEEWSRSLSDPRLGRGPQDPAPPAIQAIVPCQQQLLGREGKAGRVQRRVGPGTEGKVDRAGRGT